MKRSIKIGCFKQSHPIAHLSDVYGGVVLDPIFVLGRRWAFRHLINEQSLLAGITNAVGAACRRTIAILRPSVLTYGTLER